MASHAGSAALCIGDMIMSLGSAGVGCRVEEDSARIGGLIESADVVHIHGFGYPAAVAAAKAARRCGRPYVISPLGALWPAAHSKPGWGGWFRRRLRDRGVLGAAAAVTTLNSVEERMLRERGVGKALGRLTYGIDFSAWEQLEAAESAEPLLLFLGPIHPEEGLVALLRAAAELGGEFAGWRIVMAGVCRGSWREQIEAAVQRKGGGQRVKIVADPDESSQRQLLSSASIVAAPAMRPCLSATLLQAIAAGIPVIASELVVPWGAEGVVRGCRPAREDLRDGLKRMLCLSDGERRAEAVTIRDRCRESLGASSSAGEWARLYEGVMSVEHVTPGKKKKPRSGATSTTGG